MINNHASDRIGKIDAFVNVAATILVIALIGASYGLSLAQFAQLA